MSLTDLQQLTSDLFVCRQVIKDLEEKIIEATKELQKELDEMKTQKTDLQDRLLSIMGDAGLTQWKTENGTFSKQCRVSVTPSGWYKKEVETKIKAGMSVDGWEKKETNFISIRLANNG